MTDYKRKKAEMELRAFTAKNFEKPSDCRNLDQIRYYVGELADKIRQMENTCNYAPEWAYSMLAQYNAAQNSMLLVEFRNEYR